MCTTQSGSKRASRDVVRLRSSSLTRKNTRNNVADSCLNCCFTGIHFSCVVVEKSRVWSGWSSSGRVASFSGWPASVPASLSTSKKAVPRTCQKPPNHPPLRAVTLHTPVTPYPTFMTMRYPMHPNSIPSLLLTPYYSSIFSPPAPPTTPAFPSPKCFNNQLLLKYVFGCTIVSKSLPLQLPSCLTLLISFL